MGGWLPHRVKLIDRAVLLCPEVDQRVVSQAQPAAKHVVTEMALEDADLRSWPNRIAQVEECWVRLVAS